MIGSRRLVLMAVALGLVVAGCAGNAGADGPPVSAGPVSGTWIDVNTTESTVSVPFATIEKYANTHFSVATGGSSLDYMAYLLGDKLHVRANVCPPCRSRGFALDGEVLVCDACATMFDARDGSGIEGACVDYPKASVSYEIVDGAVTMQVSDLVAAFDATVVPG